MIRTAALGLAAAVCAWSAEAQHGHIVLLSTTSTQNSGLYDAVLPQFTAETGTEVRVVAVGSGQALRHAADCNGEAVIVHAPAAEAAFVEAGHAAERFELMRNDYVIIGPEHDPAGIAGAASAADAFARIASGGHPFVSRADKSGTHSREIRIWTQAGVDPRGPWHRETGAGMGGTLNIAVGMDAYTLTDRGTWITFGNKRRHRILFEGGSGLVNIYSVMAVNPDRCRRINAAGAQRFLDWILSETGQTAIGAFQKDGVPLFIPSYPR